MKVSTTDFEGNEFVKRAIMKHFVRRTVNCLFIGITGVFC